MGYDMEEGEEELQEPDGSKTPEHVSLKHLNRACGVSWRLKQHSGSLYRSELGPLHICNGFITWCSCGSPNNRNEDCL